MRISLLPRPTRTRYSSLRRATRANETFFSRAATSTLLTDGPSPTSTISSRMLVVQMISIIVLVNFPDFTDHTTQVGAVILTLFTALTVSAPFVARAIVQGPGATEVAVEGMSVRDASGAPLECDTVEAPFPGESSEFDWQWNCDGTTINARKKTTDEEQDQKLALARYMRRATFQDQPDPNAVEEPAPGILTLEGDSANNDVSVSLERDGSTVYFFLTGVNAREFADRLVETEAR